MPSIDSSSKASFLAGKVVIDDGTPLTDQAIIQSICNGNIRNEGYTDQKGNFSFDLKSPADVLTSADTNNVSVLGNRLQGGEVQGRDLRQCELQAVLPGFQSQMIELASKSSDIGNLDVGTIVLHRLAHVEGFTISATSAAAPDKAKKEYEKAREEEKKGKWDAAQQRLTKAVQIYPRYAVAWFELGLVQLQHKDQASAKTSFRQSIAADEKYISPYGELAEMAYKEQQWKDLDEATDHLLSLNPLSFPQYWFYNSVANYLLENFDKAQKSAKRGIDSDVQHRVPRLEYVLGMVLVKRGDYQGALMHVRNYIRLQPNASDIKTVEKQIAELERLTSPTASQKN